MTALYLFCAAAGVPLVAWFLLNGNEDSGDAGAGSDGVDAVMLRLLPLSSVALATAVFGVAGLALGAVGTGAVVTFVGSLVVALIAGALNSAAFAFLRRSNSYADVDDRALAGSMGRVVVPVGSTRRGRIVVNVGDQPIPLSAQAVPDQIHELGVGTPVLVVEVANGIATVTRLDPELLSPDQQGELER